MGATVPAEANPPKIKPADSKFHPPLDRYLPPPGVRHSGRMVKPFPRGGLSGSENHGGKSDRG